MCVCVCVYVCVCGIEQCDTACGAAQCGVHFFTVSFAYLWPRSLVYNSPGGAMHPARLKGQAFIGICHVAEIDKNNTCLIPLQLFCYYSKFMDLDGATGRAQEALWGVGWGSVNTGQRVLVSKHRTQHLGKIKCRFDCLQSGHSFYPRIQKDFLWTQLLLKLWKHPIRSALD